MRRQPRSGSGDRGAPWVLRCHRPVDPRWTRRDWGLGQQVRLELTRRLTAVGWSKAEAYDTTRFTRRQTADISFEFYADIDPMGNGVVVRPGVGVLHHEIGRLAGTFLGLTGGACVFGRNLID